MRTISGTSSPRARSSSPREKISDNAVHALLNIVRELAANAVRHGGASVVRVSGSLEDGMLSCAVEDDGFGFDPDDRPGLAEGHFVDELGGELSIRSRKGEGTRVSFRIRAE